MFPCPPLCCQGWLGMRACVPRHGSLSSTVTPSSQLLVWATSSQARRQAPVCSLELIWEEVTAKIPRQRWEAEGREGLALNFPNLCQRNKSRRPEMRAQRHGAGRPLLKGAGIKEEPLAGWLSRLCAAPGLGQMRSPQGKEEITNEKSEAPACQSTHVVAGCGYPKNHSVNNCLLSAYTAPTLRPCRPPQMLMGLATN